MAGKRYGQAIQGNIKETERKRKQEQFSYPVSCLSVPNPEAWDDNNSNKAGQKNESPCLFQVWAASSVQCPHEWSKPPNTRPRPSTASRDSESFLGVQPVDQKSLIQRGGTTERRLLLLLTP
ncbi:predicted protein [Histoplasma capsulatum var. duboisii H88]|uniref:Predicted protein n=1 Tax=Ajellomyces capsulatus (strain H88) TaxID=544711 RepID=F0UHS2_AJEC8|nr:predicted protein [Histoplasma capsulatum var. duboisii H88]